MFLGRDLVAKIAFNPFHLLLKKTDGKRDGVYLKLSFRTFNLTIIYLVIKKAKENINEKTNGRHRSLGSQGNSVLT